MAKTKIDTDISQDKNTKKNEKDIVINTANTKQSGTAKDNSNDNAQDKGKKQKKEKVLSPKQLAKQQAAEKAARIEDLRQQQRSLLFEREADLSRKRFTEMRRIRKSLITNGIILIVGVGMSVFLMTIYTLLVFIAVPIAAITIFNIVRCIVRLRKLKNPYEIRKIIILDDAKKAHNDRNRKIVEAYKKEKKRIKTLKRLPYKILGSASFLVSMFTIILFFFVLDINIEATALILFGVFTLTYFMVGLLMIGVFYLISENKQREMLLKLEDERRRMLAEEKLRSDIEVRDRLEAERRKYEEEERLRIDEQRRAAEEEAEMQRKLEEEQRLLEIAEEEKKKLLKNTRMVEQDLLPPPSKAEIAQEIESIRNDFDKKILDEVRNKFTGLDLGGIETFADKSKLKTEYAAGAIFPDEDLSDRGLEQEFANSNATLDTIRRTDDYNSVDDLTDFDTDNIDEAKDILIKRTLEKAEKIRNDGNEQQPTPTKQDLNSAISKMPSHIPQPVNPPISDRTQQKDKAINGKSFMVIKQMLKDE